MWWVHGFFVVRSKGLQSSSVVISGAASGLMCIKSSNNGEPSTYTPKRPPSSITASSFHPSAAGLPGHVSGRSQNASSLPP
mmetsp:Transcript_2071/g.5464  ORF Transcript_2071/g.5464 Transcript_2071/m.5464 type:complete len:81 (+) Transcript_2071:165-407(+)